MSTCHRQTLLASRNIVASRRSVLLFGTYFSGYFSDNCFTNSNIDFNAKQFSRNITRSARESTIVCASGMSIGLAAGVSVSRVLRGRLGESITLSGPAYDLIFVANT